MAFASMSAATTAATATDAVAAPTLVDAAANLAGTTAAASSLPSATSLASYAALGSSALSGVGALSQGEAAKAAAGYNATVAAQNASIAKQNAQFAGAEGEQNAGAAGAQTRARVGATLANEGAAGVDVNTGSAVDARESEAKLGMLNALNIRSQAARAAYGYQTQQATDIGQSNLEKSQETPDVVGSGLTAASDVLGGVSKASQFSNWLQNGGPAAGLTE